MRKKQGAAKLISGGGGGGKKLVGKPTATLKMRPSWEKRRGVLKGKDLRLGDRKQERIKCGGRRL